jgi:hypothetical protein
MNDRFIIVWNYGGRLMPTKPLRIILIGVLFILCVGTQGDSFQTCKVGQNIASLFTPPSNFCAFSYVGNDLDNIAYLPTLDLRTFSTAELKFYIQYQTKGDDGCYLHVKIDDGSWNLLDEFKGIQTQWLQKSYNLDEFTGHTVRFRFRYHTGLSSLSMGAYLDLITVSGDGATVLFDENFEDYVPNDSWGEWTIVEKTGPNSPPLTPSSPTPLNNSINVSVLTDLSWTCSDPDPDDSIAYDVYFGSSLPLVLRAANQTNTTYELEKLDYNTIYYWRIVAWDLYDNATASPLWIFRTVTNQPPYIPSNPEPADGATYVYTYTILNWTSGDPYNDLVTYDLFFGATSTPPLLVADLTESTFSPGKLENNTQYYWRIRARDQLHLNTTGPLWTFKTALAGNNPPFKPNRPSGPTTGRIQFSYSYRSQTSDPDLDKVYYLFDWDDGTRSGWLGPYDSGQPVYASHVWSSPGTYQIKVKAKDTIGLESSWSDPLSLTMPKSMFAHFLSRFFPNILQFFT